MSYQTGNAVSMSDLLEKLSEFSQSIGWVIDKFKSGSSAELYLHSSAGYFSLGVSGTTLLLFGNTAYDSGKTVSAQPGSSAVNQLVNSSVVGTGVTEMGDPYVSYDFFGTTQYIHVVVQTHTGRFRHFGFGVLNKEGVYSGGQYVYGTYLSSFYSNYLSSNNGWPFSGFLSTSYNAQRYCTFVRCDKDSNPFWYGLGYVLQFKAVAGVSGFGLGNAGIIELSSQNHPDEFKVKCSQSQFGQFITPVENAVYILTADGIYRRIGTVPDFQVCQMRGITPRTIFDIAGERWMVIPPTQYQPSTATVVKPDNNSYIAGYALRVIE